MGAKLKVLVVDDSLTTRQMLAHLINHTDDMCVAGEAEDGNQAVQMTRTLSPDVVLMDVVMPQMDGLEATRQIMQARPTPIVLVSASLGTSETDIAFKAIKAGALTVLHKPGLPDTAGEIKHLLNTLRAMAGVQVIHHYHNSREQTPAAAVPLADGLRPQIVAIAASTGGPAALSEILWNLPVDFALPVVIVQHIAADFIPSLVGWLNHISKLPVQIAPHGHPVMNGRIYVAPGSGHLMMTVNHQFMVTQQPTARFMPSGDILLESIARVYGKQAVGIVLTGMGDDGARGLRAMYQAGAHTIAQDERSAVVFGMPNAAIQLGAARQILPLPKIAQALASFSHQEI